MSRQRTEFREYQPDDVERPLLAPRSRTTSLILSADSMHGIAGRRGLTHAAYVEDHLLGRVDRLRHDKGVTITWEAASRVSPTGQPEGDLERLPYQPGTPLPDHAVFVECCVTVSPVADP